MLGADIASPALWARKRTEGKFKIPRHIAYLDDLIVRALNGMGSKRIVVSMPPRHGKSFYISEHLPAWYVGMFPDNQVILTSYEAEFAAEFGGKARDLIANDENYLGVRVDPTKKSSSFWKIDGHRGGVKTAGARGPITGRGAHLFIIDDPIKNSEEAQSETLRNKNWDWFRSTAYSRLEPGGVMVVVQTRWHMDDLAGRIIRELANVEPWEVVSFPAIAEEHDVLGRAPGEPLWPDRIALPQLENIRGTVGPFWWSALYQQRPTPAEGGLFKLEFFNQFYDVFPQVVKSCRFWDLAATKNSDSDFTVGLMLSLCDDGNFYVMDIVRGRWAPYERDRIIKQVAQLDGYNVKIRMEKEPGASGESLIDSMGRMLTGHNFRGIRSKDSKMARVNSIDGIASVAGVGRLRLRKGHWTREFIDELIMFPNAQHDDQVDALSGAYKALTQEKTVYVA
jgi:predicted phage terminase large subunit-like protein